MGRRAHLPTRSFKARPTNHLQLRPARIRTLSTKYGFRPDFDLAWELSYALSWYDTYRDHDPIANSDVRKMFNEAGEATKSLIMHLDSPNAAALLDLFDRIGPTVSSLALCASGLQELAQAADVVDVGLTKRQRSDICAAATKLAVVLDKGSRILLPDLLKAGDRVKSPFPPSAGLLAAVTWLGKVIPAAAEGFQRLKREDFENAWSATTKPSRLSLKELTQRLYTVYRIGTRRGRFIKAPFNGFLLDVLSLTAIKASRSTLITISKEICSMSALVSLARANRNRAQRLRMPNDDK